MHTHTFYFIHILIYTYTFYLQTSLYIYTFYTDLRIHILSRVGTTLYVHTLSSFSFMHTHALIYFTAMQNVLTCQAYVYTKYVYVQRLFRTGGSLGGGKGR